MTNSSDDNDRIPAGYVPRVELVLSRSAYRCGDTVCGTVRLYLHPREVNDSEASKEDEEEEEEGEHNDMLSDMISGIFESCSERNDNAGKHRRKVENTEQYTAPQIVHDLSDNDKERDEEHRRKLRQIFTYATVHISGKCRLDPRWHPAVSGSSSSALLELYGGSIHPLLSGLPNETKRILAIDRSDVGGVTSSSDVIAGIEGQKLSTHYHPSVCFFATNCVDLLSLEERIEPPPKKPFVPRFRSSPRVPSVVESGEATTTKICDANHIACSHSKCNLEPMDKQKDPFEGTFQGKQPHQRPKKLHLAFTFRAQLPGDLPHSVHATCCQYSYSAVASVKVNTGEVLTAQIFFAVLSCSRLNLHAPQRCHPADIEAMYPTANGEQASGGRVRVGVCSATAHSSGYPCYVSPSTLNRLRQIGVSSTGLCSSMTARDCKTVRVTNTEGLPFCVLTMIGTSTILPGGRTILQFNFNNLDDSDSDTSSPRAMNRTGIGASEKLRCLQVCACFRLSERAIFGKTRKATKEQVFDAQYARVDEDTDTLSLSLILPMDAPCTLSTDLVEISTFCQLEMTVAKSAGGELKIEVMKLEVPCGVVHTKIYSEQHGVNFGTGNQSALSANIPFHSDANDENGSADMDLLNDITMLAIRMMEECGEA